MRLAISLIFLFFYFIGIGQSDTLQAFIKKRRINSNYVLYEQKIGAKIENKLTYNPQKVHDYFIEILDKSIHGWVIMRFVDRRGKIFAVGKWNEAGFQGNVSYYNRHGKLVSTINFEEETSQGNVPD